MSSLRKEHGHMLCGSNQCGFWEHLVKGTQSGYSPCLPYFDLGLEFLTVQLAVARTSHLAQQSQGKLQTKALQACTLNTSPHRLYYSHKSLNQRYNEPLSINFQSLPQSHQTAEEEVHCRATYLFSILEHTTSSLRGTGLSRDWQRSRKKLWGSSLLWQRIQPWRWSSYYNQGIFNCWTTTHNNTNALLLWYNPEAVTTSMSSYLTWEYLPFVCMSRSKRDWINTQGGG